MEILIAPEAELSPELLDQVNGLRAEAWPREAPPWSGPVHDPALAPLSVLLLGEGRVVAALDILSKEIDHGGERYAASGLSTVVTGVAFRGVGYGLELIEAAREQIAASGADLALFTCDTSLRGFYEQAGFEVLPGSVLVGGTRQKPFPSDQFDKVTLARLISARARAARGAFTDARIGLYPGVIDKLW